MNNNSRPHDTLPDENEKLQLNAICQALKGLQYGSVNIIVQDGCVIQIERTEKLRVRRKADTTHPY
jgi:hypothetical protein